MQVLKRDGRIEDFDPKKIDTAVQKANDAVAEEYRAGILKRTTLINRVVDQCSRKNPTIGVETIHDLVENCLMDLGLHEVAREYITYRYRRKLAHDSNTTDDKILDIVELRSEEAKQENSNKNPVIISTQRDYIAGEVSRDITERILLPDDVVQAHREGIIHFHDSDYYIGHAHNCFTGDTKFLTERGVRRFKDFHDGDPVIVRDKDGHPRVATVHKYGKQRMQKVTLKGGRMTQEIVCTPNHRWILLDGSVTTSLKVGDRLYGTPESTHRDGFVPGAEGELLDCKINRELAEAFCTGFIVGDGTDRKDKFAQVRLCGEKTMYRDVFELAGYHSYEVSDSLDVVMSRRSADKQHFLNGKGWRFMSYKQKAMAFHGYMAADGAKDRRHVSTADARVREFIEETSCCAGYYISSVFEEVRDTNFKKNAYLATYHFILKTPDNWAWKVTRIEPYGFEPMDAWCVEEPETHSFLLDKGIVTGNCDLVNLEDMLQNGTVITGTLIERPHSFSTACNITTQIIAQVASNQYGGQSISLTHLAPFVEESRKRIKAEVAEEWGMQYHTPEFVADIVEERLKAEIRKGVQTLQYQIITLLTTNGQAPFITVFMYLNEARSEQEKEDLALIIREMLKQRIQGVKNEKGVWITPAFPKLIYVLEEDNITEGSRFWDLTKLAAECTAKRMVPDYISEKKMLELKGECYTCMGCRSFLTPDRFTDAGVGNIANAGTYEPGKHRYYGRFNQGVVTINLPDVALTTCKMIEESGVKPWTQDAAEDLFFSVFEKRLELCHKALRCRHERLLGTPSDVAPILWQHGALARLEKGEPIDKLLYNGYSTISLGYAGLYECVKAMTGKSHTDPEATPFALAVMQKMNDKCNEWKEAENIDYSLYGTPLESTTYKFARALQKRFGVIEGVTDKDYITNSYHVHVTEQIDAFTKLAFEAEFQHLSPGGAISYIEVPDLKDNIPAVLSVMQFIYEHIIYAELNCKSDYCQVCGWDGEIDVTEQDGKLIWKCPNCGNTDQNKMNVARRTCGLNK